MAADEELTAAFAALRPRLLRTAYGILGSVVDAEDVVQEAWLRLDRVEAPDATRDLQGAPRSCCTTCSGCRSTRSARSWAGLPPRSVSSRAAPGATSSGRSTAGQPRRDGILNVLAFTVDGAVITSIASVRNPDKLRHVMSL